MFGSPHGDNKIKLNTSLDNIVHAVFFGLLSLLSRGWIRPTKTVCFSGPDTMSYSVYAVAKQAGWQDRPRRGEE